MIQPVLGWGNLTPDQTEFANGLHRREQWRLWADEGSVFCDCGKRFGSKESGSESFLPIDIAKEALIANASFVACSFAGDPAQVRELLKAASAIVELQC